MKLSLNWLNEYIDLSGLSLEDIADKLTMAGIEVEAIEKSCSIPEGVVVGEILSREKHPDADKLSVCTVSDGENELQVVCGAPNCDAGKKVPLATIGTVFATPEGEFRIKKSKLRGVKSHGMLCSARELNLSEDHDGLLELDPELKTGADVRDIFPGDTVFELEITPNRPDWLSHWGVARDLACIVNREAKLPEFSLPEVVAEEFPDLVEVRDFDLCLRYTARVIRGVRIGESPDWLRERLLSVGLRPINNVVDITNFVMLELGQPLHAFDFDELAGHRIIVRDAVNGEKMTMLDDTELELSQKNLLIADGEKPRALAGVMGGLDSGVTEKTVNILLESALFNPSNIRATSRASGISTDSSYRFERGVDFAAVETASTRAAALILELAGGRLVSDFVDIKRETPEPPQIKCRFEKIRKLTGLDIGNTAICDIFRKLRLAVTDENAVGCLVKVPSFRLDLEREADLAEEVARIVGLDALPDVPLCAKSAGSFAEDAYYPFQVAREQLIAMGLRECVHYSMVSEKSALLDSRFSAEDLIKISNPLNLDMECMRPGLFSGMLECAERNIARKNLDLRLFEIGNVFCKNPKLYPEERSECAILLSGRRHPERFSGELRDIYDFYDLKGLLEGWFDSRKLKNVDFEAVNDERFEPGRCLELKTSDVFAIGEIVGKMGQVATKYCAKFKTSYPIFMATINLGIFLRLSPFKELFSEISQFPSTTRDVAFAADESLQHRQIIQFIARCGIKNLEKVELFDLFRDEKVLGKGRKSMAYTLTFRNPQRTLTDKEVNAAFEKMRRHLAKEFTIELR